MTFEDFENEFGPLDGVDPVLAFTPEQLEILAEYMLAYGEEVGNNGYENGYDAGYDIGHMEALENNDAGYTQKDMDEAYWEGREDGLREAK